MFNHHSQMSKPNVKICDLIAISIDEDDYVSAMSKSGKDMHTICVSNEKLAQRIGVIIIMILVTVLFSYCMGYT